MRVRLLCVRDTRIGGVHHLEGETVSVQKQDVNAWLETGCFERVS